MPAKIQHYGIDTSVFVRLLTGEPAADYEATLAALRAILDKSPQSELRVSNMVVGEAYVALQYHYDVSKPDARKAIATLLQSGLVTPVNGTGVIDILGRNEGCGLLDRLIADDYAQAGLTTLTNDRKMAALGDVKRLG